MTARDELDLAVVLAQVVQPVIGALLRPGEVEAIALGWQTPRRPVMLEPTRGPGLTVVSGLVVNDLVRWVDVEVLLLVVIAKGEPFEFDVAYPGDGLADLDLAFLRDELRSRLQDFIAESRFGWGELRG